MKHNEVAYKYLNINTLRCFSVIFNCLELGANGLVLAAETAIGKNPINSVLFLKKMIKVFKNYIYFSEK